MINRQLIFNTWEVKNVPVKFRLLFIDYYLIYPAILLIRILNYAI